MFSPKLYKVRKIPAKKIIDSSYNLFIDDNDFIVSQQDCMMFRHIRNVTKKDSEYIKEIIFVDCNGSKGKKEDIKNIVINGFYVNGVHFSITERSASMTRNAILGFIDTKISNDINDIITMDLEINKTVLSKYYAYRGLMFSSCHCLENYFPKIIVVKDYEKILEKQKIKYLVKKETFYEKDGNLNKWEYSDIEEGYKDINLNVFDGCGIHHPSITDDIIKIIGMSERPTTIMIRAPYIKGLSSEIDYTKYFKDHGIDFIKDIWGNWHSVEDKMIIITESMYKGYKYFKKYDDSRDWDLYWSKFHKYNHCIGIAKWNFTKEQEPVYTRANYQILQDLDLDFEDFKQLTEKSLEWVQNVVDGNPLYTYCFLGLTGENPKPINSYAKAIMKNPNMMKEDCVRDFLKKQIRKYIDKMKCGKIYIKACYKFLLPDMIMLLQWIGGDNNPVGALKDDECWSIDYNGEYLIERNPHICKSEHLILNAVKNEEIDKYCGHLVNTCMINGYSLSAQRLNGADYPSKVQLDSNINA